MSKVTPEVLTTWSDAVGERLNVVRPKAVAAEGPVTVRIPVPPDDADLSARLGNSARGIEGLVSLTRVSTAAGPVLEVTGQAQWVTALFVRWRGDVRNHLAGASNQGRAAIGD